MVRHSDAELVTVGETNVHTHTFAPLTQITGLYRAIGGASNGSTSGVFRTLIIANNIAVLGKDVGR